MHSLEEMNFDTLPVHDNFKSVEHLLFRAAPFFKCLSSVVDFLLKFEIVARLKLMLIIRFKNSNLYL